MFSSNKNRKTLVEKVFFFWINLFSFVYGTQRDIPAIPHNEVIFGWWFSLRGKKKVTITTMNYTRTIPIKLLLSLINLNENKDMISAHPNSYIILYYFPGSLYYCIYAFHMYYMCSNNIAFSAPRRTQPVFLKTNLCWCKNELFSKAAEQ